MSNEDHCGVCGQHGELICCDKCPSSYHYSVSPTQCIGAERSTQRARWFCPPCTNEIKIEDRAAAEHWTDEKKAQMLEKIKHQRQLSGASRQRYDDPLPELKKITDFLDESSEEDIEDYRLTRVGPQFQAFLPLHGELSLPRSECYRVWEAGRLSPGHLDTYMRRAREVWQDSYLRDLKDFNEMDACTVLHLKQYDVEAALTALAKERLPYITVCEHEGSANERDLEQLRGGVPLLQSSPASCHP